MDFTSTCVYIYIFKAVHLTQFCGKTLTDHNILWVTSSCLTDRSRNGDLSSAYVQGMTTRISEKEPNVHNGHRVRLFREWLPPRIQKNQRSTKQHEASSSRSGSVQHQEHYSSNGHTHICETSKMENTTRVRLFKELRWAHIQREMSARSHALIQRKPPTLPYTTKSKMHYTSKEAVQTTTRRTHKTKPKMHNRGWVRHCKTSWRRPNILISKASQVRPWLRSDLGWAKL